MLIRFEIRNFTFRDLFLIPDFVIRFFTFHNRELRYYLAEIGKDL